MTLFAFKKFEQKYIFQATVHTAFPATTKNSGGVGILIKNELLEGVEIIENKSCSGYLIFRLKKDFFRLIDDIYLVNSVAENKRKDILFQIDDIVNDLKGNGEVILCGDFNSRIGDQPGIFKNDSNKFYPCLMITFLTYLNLEILKIG